MKGKVFTMSLNSHRIFGVLLIVVGTIILLSKFGFFELSFSDIFWPIISILGFFLVFIGYGEHNSGKIIWGTIFFLFGLFFFLKSIDVVYIPSSITLPVALYILGTAFMMAFFNSVKNWFLLIFVFIFYLLGSAFLLSYLGFWEKWEVWENLRIYWPIILVIIGLGLLLVKRKRSPDSGQY